jgi:peptidoglycan-N-acetylglucosamine deacetylase
MLSRVITNVETQEAAAALTFDDGPHPVYTPRVLDVLTKHGAKATFFMLGESARSHPNVLRRVVDGGHAIGNHTWTHLNLCRVRSRIRRLKLMWDGARAIRPHCRRLFRPPYGAHNRQVLLDASLFRYRTILWCASAQDWTLQGPEEIARKIVDRMTPGTIFLLHDAIVDRKGNEAIEDREPMIEGLDRALAQLSRTIRFVTLPSLLRTGRPVSRWPLNTHF